MKISKDNLNKFVFYFAYTLLVANVMFAYVKGVGKAINILKDLALVLLIINFFVQSKKYKRKEFIILLLIISISAVVTFVSKDREIIKIVLLICTAISIDFQKFIKYDFKLKLISTIIIILCYYLNLTDVYYMYRSDGTIRSSMGFSHPNIFGGFVFSIVCDYIFLRKDKINIFDIVVIILLSFGVSYFSDSRTSQICIILVMLGSIFIKIDKIKILDLKLVKFIVNNSFFIFSIISFILAYLLVQNNPTVINLNESLSGRISFIARFFDEYVVNLFGREIEIIGTLQSKTTGESPWILDNSYAMILLRYGVVTFLMMGIFLNIFFKNTYKYDKYILIIMFVFLILRNYRKHDVQN